MGKKTEPIKLVLRVEDVVRVVCQGVPVVCRAAGDQSVQLTFGPGPDDMSLKRIYDELKPRFESRRAARRSGRPAVDDMDALKDDEDELEEDDDDLEEDDDDDLEEEEDDDEDDPNEDVEIVDDEDEFDY